MDMNMTMGKGHYLKVLVDSCSKRPKSNVLQYGTELLSLVQGLDGDVDRELREGSNGNDIQGAPIELMSV